MILFRACRNQRTRLTERTQEIDQLSDETGLRSAFYDGWKRDTARIYCSALTAVLLLCAVLLGRRCC